MVTNVRQLPATFTFWLVFLYYHEEVGISVIGKFCNCRADYMVIHLGFRSVNVFG
jgi:hypothetical protein